MLRTSNMMSQVQGKRQALKEISNNKKVVRDGRLKKVTTAATRPAIARATTATAVPAAKARVTEHSSVPSFGEIANVNVVQQPIQIPSYDVQKDVEMVDATPMQVEPLIDLDEEVRHDDAFSSEYAEDCVNFCREKELRDLIPPTFLGTTQREITKKIRAVVVDWLVLIHLKFKLSDETLHLSVRIMDKFLSKVPVAKHKIQLVAVTSTFIAAKYNQIWAPYVRHLLYYADNQYKETDVFQLEGLILNTFDFRLEFVTPMYFYERMLRAAGYQKEPKMHHFSRFLMELALMDYDMLKYTPSMISASAVWVSHNVKNKNATWTPLMQKYAKYDEENLMECVRDLINIWKAPSMPKCDTTRTKYASSKLGRVSRVAVPEYFR